MPKVDATPTMPPARLIGIINTEEVGSSLHKHSAQGDKKQLKKILKTGISVDYPNSAGQTALFCACFEGHEGIVDILLQHNANPNERSNEGSTAVHAAGYSCSPKILSKLIEAGGDLRYHDNKGRTIREWILCQGDNKKRVKMMEYLEKMRHVALTSSNKDLLLERQPSTYYNSMKKGATNQSSFVSLFRHKSSQRSLVLSPSVHSSGYGKIYFGDREHIGTMATIPLVSEGSLRHDEFGYTFNNGAFMVMESMLWCKVPVTVKRLHRDPPEGGNVDLLIRENEFMARLRHPNILLLMGVCQTNNLEGLVLLYERVGCGSLYSYLYQKVESLDTLSMCEIMKQIAEALLYLHQEGLLHCHITSHAIQLVMPNFAKLTNLEYMVEIGSESKCKVVENKYLNAAYNWAAPELLAGKTPTEKSDLYSLCAVLWEILHGMPPWSGMHAPEITTEVVENRTMLEIKESVKNPFCALLQYGLNIDPKGRQMSVEQFRDMLGQVLVDHNTMGIKGDTPYPQRASKKYGPGKKNQSFLDESGSSDDEETTDVKPRMNSGTSMQKPPVPMNRASSAGSESRSGNETVPKRRISSPEKRKIYMESPLVRADVMRNKTPEPEIKETETKPLEKPLSEKPIPPKRPPRGPTPAKSPRDKSVSSDQTDNTIATEKDMNNNSVTSYPEDPVALVNETSFNKEEAKRAFFGTTWTKPHSTSTPTSSSPAVASTAQEYFKTSDVKMISLATPVRSDDHTDTPEKAREGSPENPFKKEFQQFKADEIMKSFYRNQTIGFDKPTATSTTSVRCQTITFDKPVTTVTKVKYQSAMTQTPPAFKPVTQNIAVQHHSVPTVAKETATVFGALQPPQVSRMIRPNAIIRSNYFVAKDQEVEDKETMTAGPGPVYTTVMGGAYTMPGNRHSYAEGFIHPFKVGGSYSAYSQPGMRNTIGSRYSWVQVQNQHENPGCFKPASHRSDYTSTPGKVARSTTQIPSKVNFAVPENYEPPPPTCPGSPKANVRFVQSQSSAFIPKVTRFADVVDGKPKIRSESHLLMMHPSPGTQQKPVKSFSQPAHASPPTHTPTPQPRLRGKPNKPAHVTPPSQFYNQYVQPYPPTPPNYSPQQYTPSPQHFDSSGGYPDHHSTPPERPQSPPSPTRSSPREQKEEWYGGKAIGDLISSFQTHSDQHLQKQAILVLKSRKKEEAMANRCQEPANQCQDPANQCQEQIQPTPQPAKESTERAMTEENCESSPRPASQRAHKTLNISKSMEMGPHGLKNIGPFISCNEVRPPSGRFISEHESVNLGSCPSQQHRTYLRKTDTDGSETDTDVYDVIDTALYKAHSQVMDEFVSHDCPHKADSLAKVRGMSRHNLNNNCAPGEPRNTGSCLSMSSRCSNKPPGGSSSDHVTGNSGRVTASSSSHSGCSRPLSTSSSRTDTQTKDANLSLVSDIPGSPPLRGAEIEEFYFDDVLGKDLMKEKHMRLQTTLPLDDSYNKSSASFDSWLSTSGMDNAGNVSQKRGRRDRNRRMQRNPVRDGFIPAHVTIVTSCWSVVRLYLKTDSRWHRLGPFPGLSEKNLPLDTFEVRKMVQSGPKCEAYTTTLQVKTDKDGNHKITGTTTDLMTGQTTTDYRKDSSSGSVITSIVMDEEELLV